MTIQIPDDLARDLEGIATAQHKSVEQVAVDSLRERFNRTGSPEVLLRAFRKMARVRAEDVADLEASIESGRLPVSDKGVFD
jgi:predicted transcriptional regulator